MYTWDAANRLVSADVDGVVSTYTYNPTGGFAPASAIPSPLALRGTNCRTSQTVDGVTTEYVLDTSAGLSAGVAGDPSASLRTGLPEVIVATTGGASTRYVQVQGQILAQYESGAWAYVTPDALPAPVAPRPLARRPGRAGPDGTGQAQADSVRQLTNAGGQVILAQSFDPFGVPFEASGSGASDFGHTGEWWDLHAVSVSAGRDS